MFKEVQGDIFEELDLKKSGKNLQVQALGGIEVIDTEDFYGDIRTLYPEEKQQLDVRYEAIGDHYKEKHTQNAGRNVAIIVVSHGGILTQIPYQFGQTEAVPIQAGHCASFEVVFSDDQEPKVIQTLYNSYI